MKFRGMPGEKVVFIVLADGAGVARFETENEADAFTRKNEAKPNKSPSGAAC